METLEKTVYSDLSTKERYRKESPFLTKDNIQYLAGLAREINENASKKKEAK